MFNWQGLHKEKTQQAEFLRWLLPQLTGGPDFEKMAEASKGFTEVELTILVNGVPCVDSEAWLARLYGQFQALVEDAALKSVDARFQNLLAAIETAREPFDEYNRNRYED